VSGSEASSYHTALKFLFRPSSGEMEEAGVQVPQALAKKTRRTTLFVDELI
jgi:hypothetical protein